MAPPPRAAPRVSNLVAAPPPVFQPSGLDLFLSYTPPTPMRPKYALTGPPPLKPTPSTYFRNDAFAAARAEAPPLLEAEEEEEAIPPPRSPLTVNVAVDESPLHKDASELASPVSDSSLPPVSPSSSARGSFSSITGSVTGGRPQPGSSAGSGGSVVSKIFGGPESKRNSQASSNPPESPKGSEKSMGRSNSFISFLGSKKKAKEPVTPKSANGQLPESMHPRTSELNTSKAAAAAAAPQPKIEMKDWYGPDKGESFEYGLRQGQHVFVPDNEPLDKAKIPEKGLEFQAKARDHMPKILLELKSHQED